MKKGLINKPIIMFYENMSFAPSKYIKILCQHHNKELFTYDAKGFLEAYLNSRALQKVQLLNPLTPSVLLDNTP